MLTINLETELARTEEIQKHPLQFRGTSTEFYRFVLELLLKSGQSSVTEKELTVKIGESIVADVNEVYEEYSRE